MELKEIKKEVYELSNIREDLKNFRQHWVKPLRKNSNQHLPFLNKLDNQTKAELGKMLYHLQEDFSKIESAQIINIKLQQYSRYLVEMKLASLNGDENKSLLLTNYMLNDEFLSMKETIKEIRDFQGTVQKLSKQYEEINTLLQKKLSLEEMLFFMNLPHQRYLTRLLQTSDEHTRIVREIGHHFVSLARK